MTTDTPLDLSRYEGHDYKGVVGFWDDVAVASRRLYQDAPLLLAECKRLRTQLAERDAEVVALREALTELVAARDAWLAGGQGTTSRLNDATMNARDLIKVTP